MPQRRAGAPQLAVIDTNVLVSALIARDDTSAPARLMQQWVAGGFKPVFSMALLREWQAVIARPRLRRLHGLGAQQERDLLVELIQTAMQVEPVETAMRAPDPNDQLLWDLMAADDRLLLVTGDHALLADTAFDGRKCRPADFLAMLTEPLHA